MCPIIRDRCSRCRWATLAAAGPPELTVLPMGHTPAYRQLQSRQNAAVAPANSERPVRVRVA